MAYDVDKAKATYEALLDERSEWEAEWRSISQWLLPGRGIFSGTSKPPKRKLTTSNVINTVGEDALYVLTSGMHGGLTSPSRPWFKLEWADPKINRIELLKQWLQECDKRLHDSLHLSNFYSVVNSFYIEYCGFGTGCMFVGDDSDVPEVPFRFELLTAGEYCFSVGADGRPDQYFRVVFMTLRQFVERFPSAPKEAKAKVRDDEPSADQTYVTVLELVRRERYQDKPYKRYFFELESIGRSKGWRGQKEPLLVDGFYEFPYPLARWGTIGSDIYGIGPGSRAVNDIKRLQEMEKSFLMATHKTIDPPLNIPARMRGRVSSLPGGYNYYANPQEVVSELYQVRFDFQGVSAAIERVEQRVQRNFFNDIFLTAARDPNATPYKATEVNAREQEKMLRLGPVIERLQHEFLQPVIERCFNIMLRKNMMPELPPDLRQQAGDYNIALISPLATAQRSIALNGINSFLSFVGGMSQFDQSVLDNVDIDKATREYANIAGVEIGILRTQQEVDKRRKQRAEAMMAQRQKESQMVEEQHNAQVDVDRATARKTEAEAQEKMLSASEIAQNIGLQ